jgi:hypothetical protein
MAGRPPALGRAAWVEDLKAAVLFVKGQMRMAEDHGVRVRETPAHAGEPALGRTGVVDHGDPVPLRGEVDRVRKALADISLVDVAVHGLERRPERLEPDEDLGGAQISCVDDEVGGAHRLHARGGDGAIPTRHVGVGDDRDAHEALGVLGDLAGLQAAGADIDALGAPIV